MPKRQSRGWRIAGMLSVLVMAPGGAGCGEAIMLAGDPSATSPSNPQGAAVVAPNEVCLVGRSGGEGIECQAFRADGRLYTLIGDLDSLSGDDDHCVCGQRVEMSTCMQGTTIRVTRIGPPDTCP